MLIDMPDLFAALRCWIIVLSLLRTVSFNLGFVCRGIRFDGLKLMIPQKV